MLHCMPHVYTSTTVKSYINNKTGSGPAAYGQPGLLLGFATPKSTEFPISFLFWRRRGYKLACKMDNVDVTADIMIA